MPIVQSTFPTNYPVAFVGMVANGETSNRITRTAEDASGIGFGVAAFRGANDHGIVKAPAAGTFMGITMADKGIPMLPGATADTFPQYYDVPLLQRGAIWVMANEAIADGAEIGVTSAGLFVAVANIGAGGFALDGWVADTTTTAGAQLIRITNNRAPVQG